MGLSVEPSFSAHPRDFIRHAAIVVAFNTAIGIGLSLSRGGSWDVQMVYAQAIGLCIWALTDFGRYLFVRNPDSNWPEGWRRVVLQGGAIVIGYLTGTAIADLYCGCSTFGILLTSPRSVTGYFMMAIGASAGISFFFFARGKDQRRLRQIATAQRDAAEAQLKLLESQLEPHMLFNTLANLRVLIGIDPPRAQAMLDRLISFLRATLNASRTGRHPLAAEFARVADYLDLMKIRMADRLQIELDLPPELADCPVPPLLLQPLVENAIKHGLEPHVDGGRLRVSASREGAQLLLQVRDTGAGLSAQAATEGTRFGLQQVRDRLQALYGPAGIFELAAAGDAEGGTLASVRIPIEPA